MIQLDQLFGNHLLGGAFIEVDRLRAIKVLDCGFRDPTLLRHPMTGPVRHARLETGTLGGKCAAVDPADQTVVFEHLQVPTNSLCRHRQQRRQVSDISAAIRSDALQNEASSFLSPTSRQPRPSLPVMRLGNRFRGT